MKYYAIDFESDYDKDYGIQECGVYGYLHHKQFNPYLMSVWGEDVQWVGHPNEFDDSIFWGADVAFLAHNAGFDRQVWDRCVSLGLLHVTVPTWYCTANMSVYLGGPRSLKDAAKQLLGIEVSKEMRNYMKGKTWEQAVAEGKSEQLKQYALDDAKNCYNLWVKYNHLWPEVERQTAEITFQQTQRGVAVNTALLDTCLPRVERARADAFAEIPWSSKLDENGDAIKPLAANALKKWLAENNYTVPSTTEAKNPEFMKWQEENKDVSVVKAMQTYRSSNAMILKGSTLRNQVRPDGRYGFDMKYFGATTGRWSAGYEDDRNSGTGFNIQNIYKETLYGLNLRECIVAGPGKKFVISDYAQIEPRCLAWLCGDETFLNAIRMGVPLYEAHAIASMGWKTGPVPLKKANPKLYALAKARVLALGYGAGWAKFIFMAKMYGAGECLLTPITEKQKQSFLKYIARTDQEDKIADFKTDQDWTEAVNAWVTVMDFRSSNPKIKAMWELLEKDCIKCVGTDYRVELPSGRILPYFNVDLKGGLTVQKVMGDMRLKIWGGFLTENCLSGRTVVLTKSGFKKITALSVEDEVWDGERFAMHEGLKAKGKQQTSNCHGIYSTSDHRFLTNNGWQAAEIACKMPFQSVLSPHAKNRTTEEYFVASLRTSTCNRVIGVKREERPMETTMRLRIDDYQDDEGTPVEQRNQKVGNVWEKVRVLETRSSRSTNVSWNVKTPDLCSVEKHEATMHESEAQGISQLRGSWDYGVHEMDGLLRRIPEGHASVVQPRVGIRSQEQRGKLYAGELSLDDSEGKHEKQADIETSGVGDRFSGEKSTGIVYSLLSTASGSHANGGSDNQTECCEEVYDIQNCGPNHRFAVYDEHGNEFIVHNCTQATARDVMRDAIIRLEDAGIWTLFTVHDEIVCEVPLDFDKQKIRDIMNITPEWMPGLPLEIEQEETLFYKK